MDKKEKVNDSDQNSFLVMLMENMKQGLQSQIADMMTEMCAALPQLVKEQLTRQTAPQPQQQYPTHLHYPLHQYPPLNQNQVPANLIQVPNFRPQFPGSSY